MKILAFTAGAAQMYCGSCLRDNTLAAELKRQGHDIVLLPLYTPTRTDEPNPKASWATGTLPTIDSVYLRLVAVRPETEGHVANTAKGGAGAALPAISLGRRS